MRPLVLEAFAKCEKISQRLPDMPLFLIAWLSPMTMFWFYRMDNKFMKVFFEFALFISFILANSNYSENIMVTYIGTQEITDCP